LQTCCPQYTIRLKAIDFKHSKSQKQVYKKVEKFVLKCSQQNIVSECRRSEFLIEGKNSYEASTSSGVQSTAVELNNFASNSDQRIDYNKELCVEPGATRTKKIGLDCHQISDKCALTIETVIPEATPERFELYKRYQIAVHKDKPDEITMEAFERFLVITCFNRPAPIEGRTQGKMTVAVNTNGKDSSLGVTDACPEDYGTYHQLYRIGGKLVAVGVIDLLPSGLSSVYSYYDPDLHHLSLGKYTALREIELCKRNGFEYYYLGFYVHSCAKMRYKGEYQPSELLCPTTLSWHPLSNCIPILDRFIFSPLDPDLARERASLQVGCVSTSQSSLPTLHDMEVVNDGGVNGEIKAESGSQVTDSDRDAAVGDDGGTAVTVTPLSEAMTAPNQGEVVQETSGESAVTDAEIEEGTEPWRDLLEKYRPRFTTRAAPSLPSSPPAHGNPAVPDGEEQGNGVGELERVPLLLSDQLVYIRDLTERGQTILKDYLKDWMDVCPPEIASRLVVQIS